MDYDDFDADQTPKLHELCSSNKLPEVQELLDSGTSSNLQDSQRRTALHLASQKPNTALMQLLLKHGADPNIADSDWNCPMHMACAKGIYIHIYVY